MNANSIPAGYEIIAVKGLSELMYWLDRCSDKGHLENCPDLIEPYEAFDWRRLDTSSPSATSLAEAAEAGQVEAEPKALSHEEIAKAGLGLEYVHSVLRWAACGYVHTPDRIASLHTSYRIVDRIVNAPASPQAPPPQAVVGEASDSEKLPANAREWTDTECAAFRQGWSLGRKEGIRVATSPAPSAAPHQGADALREALADRLDAMADSSPLGSQEQSDLYAAATVWRKHINGDK